MENKESLRAAILEIVQDVAGDPDHYDVLDPTLATERILALLSAEGAVEQTPLSERSA